MGDTYRYYEGQHQAETRFSFSWKFELCVFFMRGGGPSLQTSALQMLRTDRLSSTGDVSSLKSTPTGTRMCAEEFVPRVHRVKHW